MAVTYFERGEKNDEAYARAWLKKTLQIPPRNEEERLKLIRARDLLEKLED
jgi:hypothetical protein